MSQNPVFNQPATWTLGRLVREAQVLCRIGAAPDAADFLGSDTGGVERDETLAGFVNFSLEEFLRDFPHLGLVASGATTTASDPFSDLPANLHENDISAIIWNDEAYERHGQKVRAVSAADIENLPYAATRNDRTAAWADYYAVVFDPKTGRWRIRWLPPSSIARSYIIVHRARPTDYTNVTTQASQIVPVPTSQIEPLVYLVAERIQARNTGAKSPTPEGLREQYENFRKLRAYNAPTDDELINASFTNPGTPGTSAWQDKESWEAQPGDF